jgi:hypothetical protein
MYRPVDFAPVGQFHAIIPERGSHPSLDRPVIESRGGSRHAASAFSTAEDLALHHAVESAQIFPASGWSFGADFPSIPGIASPLHPG